VHSIFPTTFLFFLTCIVVFLGQLIYTLFGFGSGIFIVTILAFFFNDISSIVILVLLLSIPIEVFIVAKSRKSIKTGNIWLMIIGLIIGIILGTELLDMQNEINLFIMMGCAIIMTSIYFIFIEDKVKPRKISIIWTLLIGIVSGVLSATFGMGGPPVILYYKFMNPPKNEFRTNLLTIFLIISCIRVPVYIYTDLLSKDLLLSSLSVLPFALFGMFVGNILHFGMDEKLFKKLTAFAMLVLGILLCFK
jgi:uncharacterized protein